MHLSTERILDSCHSGVAGSRPETQAVAEVKEGMTILTASTAEQYAMEVPGGGAGVFTSLFVDALRLQRLCRAASAQI